LSELTSIEPTIDPLPGEGTPLTPEQFGERLQREPPPRLELPDGVELTGASLAAFLESAHFPYGRYRVEGAAYFVAPSPQIELMALETWVQSRRGERSVGTELLVWRPTSFYVAAGSASEARSARPFVGPSGARAYIWLGRPLPGGPLVLRDANNVAEEVAVPEEPSVPTQTTNTEAQSHGGDGAEEGFSEERSEGDGLHAAVLRRVTDPVLRQADEALRQAEDARTAENCLREVMARPGSGGETLAQAGYLWQALGRADVAAAAFRLALERGSVEGALGLSRLAEAAGEGGEAIARPLDEAITRNLRSRELHARYAELLARMGQDAQAEWHRRQAKERVTSDE
jgi:hypothetical protein